MILSQGAVSPPKAMSTPSLALSLPHFSAHICLLVLNEDEAPVIHCALWQMEKMRAEITEGRRSRLREHPSHLLIANLLPWHPKGHSFEEQRRWRVVLWRSCSSHPVLHALSCRPQYLLARKKG